MHQESVSGHATNHLSGYVTSPESLQPGIKLDDREIRILLVCKTRSIT